MSDSSNAIDYGPLQLLIGRWKGNKGTDLAPEPEGEESTPYYETLDFAEAGTVTNAGQQTLAVLRYHQVVKRLSNDDVMHSLLIPRAVGILAGATFTGDSAAAEIALKVAAKIDDPDWSILQSPFMRDNAKTIGFEHQINVDATALRYKETTVLDIYGKVFNHSDENTLSRCSD